MVVGRRGNNDTNEAEGFLFCCLDVGDRVMMLSVVRKVEGKHVSRGAKWVDNIASCSEQSPSIPLLGTTCLCSL